MTLTEQLLHYHRRLQIERKIELAKQKFAEELDKHAERYLRNQPIIDELKRISGVADAGR